MATYEEIYGKRVEVLDADPTLTSAHEGQVWYNSATGALKSLVSFASWHSSTNLGTARYGTGIGQSQTAAALAGIQKASPTAHIGNTEEYDGSGWATSGSLNTTRYRIAGAGTQTAGMGAGGYIPGSGLQNIVEEYNGSTWTAVTVMPSSVQFQSGSGPQTAAFYTSGNYPGGDTGVTLKYDGTNWTTGPSLNSGTRQSGTVGGSAAQTACLNAGGYNPPGSPGDGSTVEEFTGSAWTTVTSLPLGIHASGSSGISTNALVFGGSAPSYVKTQAWDGTSWSESANQATSVRRVHNGGGGTDAALGMGGNPGSGATEEFSKSTYTTTAAAWASGENLNTARYHMGGAGSQTATAVFGGNAPPPILSATEVYDGSSWTTSPASLPAATQNLAGFGTSTAAIAAGGQAPGFTDATSSFNGSSWTSGPTLNTARAFLAAAIQGTTTAGLVFGGEAGPGYQTATESFDGSSWTSTPSSLPSAMSDGGGAGTQTAALIIGAESPPLRQTVLEWGGSSWTAASSLITGRTDNTAAGSQTAAITFTGQPAPGNILTEGYDGTAWSTRPNMATQRYGSTGSGTATGALASAGHLASPAAVTNATEEFTGETSTITASTLTTS